MFKAGEIVVVCKPVDEKWMYGFAGRLEPYLGREVKITAAHTKEQWDRDAAGAGGPTWYGVPVSDTTNWYDTTGPCVLETCIRARYTNDF